MPICRWCRPVFELCLGRPPLLFLDRRRLNCRLVSLILLSFLSLTTISLLYNHSLLMSLTVTLQSESSEKRIDAAGVDEVMRNRIISHTRRIRGHVVNELEERRSFNAIMSGGHATRSVDVQGDHLKSLNETHVGRSPAKTPREPEQDFFDVLIEKGGQALRRAVSGVVTSNNTDALILMRRGRSTPLFNGTTGKIHKAFSYALSGSERVVLYDIIRKFDEICTRYKFSYFLYGGSLLGSYRHHDIIPWDDDIDVLANSSEKDAIFSALDKFYPKYQVYEAGPRLKFYSQYSQRERFPWGWPYLDVQFFAENSTHIWDIAPEFKDRYVYEKRIVFPLHRRPLGGLFLNAPLDSYASILLTYTNVSHACFALAHSHEHERRAPYYGMRTPCKNLIDVYPFVHRSRLTDVGHDVSDSRRGVDQDILLIGRHIGVLESLQVGETVLHSRIVDEPAYAITDPFSLRLIDSNS